MPVTKSENPINFKMLIEHERLQESPNRQRSEFFVAKLEVEYEVSPLYQVKLKGRGQESCEAGSLGHLEEVVEGEGVVGGGVVEEEGFEEPKRIMKESGGE
ncbi:unnamed protein product, partial [Sphenostylis stenocarpa]